MTTEGPVVAITGGTSGIGRATAELLKSRNYRVAVMAIDDVSESLQELGGDTQITIGDVAVYSDCERFMTEIMDRWGTLHSVVTCAAVRPSGTVLDTEPDMWSRVFEVNVGGVYNVCRLAIPILIAGGGGSIVNVGSASGYGGEGHAAYAATKGAVVSLSMSMALDHRFDRVRVNVVAPGSTRTRMNVGRDASIDQAIAARSSVTGDINTPRQVAEAISFLLSDAANAISGTIVDVGYFRGEPVRRLSEAESS